MSGAKFEPHRIVWEQETVKRFWDWWSRQGPDEYFADVLGGAVVEFAVRRGAIGQRVLDFGCGRGHLIEHLVRRGIACQALDLSAESVKLVNERLSTNSLFKGAIHAPTIPTPLPDAAFDTIFFVETIEHLLPDAAYATLTEILRLLRVGGHVVVTTPNEEDLAANEIMCPECGCVFHRVQHIRTFSARSLADLLRGVGFASVHTEATNLRPPSALAGLREFVRRVHGKKPRNLLAVARKG